MRFMLECISLYMYFYIYQIIGFLVHEDERNCIAFCIGRPALCLF